jgi:3-oxoacyl-[acyl-carrier-protein] synthase-1
VTVAAEDVLVVGVGMLTAVGLSAAETAANVRASTMRFSEVPWRDRAFEPFTLGEVPDDGLPDLNDELAAEPRVTGREMRLVRLAAVPLLECRKAFGPAAPSPGLDLALPEGETLLPLDPAAVLRRLGKQTEGAFDPAHSDPGYRGRAGGLLAVGRAAERVREGKVPFALAGGVDTYRDSYLLATLDMEQRVKTPRNLDGFVPGEGAGFLLLGGRQAVTAARLTPLAKLSPVCQGLEEGHLYSDKPYQGDGLASAVQQLCDQSRPDRPIQEVYASMNGESHWGREWGVAYLRTKTAFAANHRLHHPADCFGDTGAACGPLLVGLAARGIAGGYRRSPALVYASSDRGPRAVLLVSAP